MNLRSQTEQLFNDIEAQLTLIEDNIGYRKTLEQLDLKLREFEKKLTTKDQEQQEKEQQFKREREYITQSLERIKEQSLNEQRIDGKRALLKQEIIDIEKEKDVLTAQKRAAEEKIKQAADLEEREQKLKADQALYVQKEAQLLKRQNQVKEDEQAVLAEAQRLQRLAERWQVN